MKIKLVVYVYVYINLETCADYHRGSTQEVNVMSGLDVVFPL